jgi:tight adherence protein B
MSLLLVTFVVSLSSILGAYWLFVVRLEGKESASVKKRLKSYRAQTNIAGVVLSPEKLSNIPWLHSALSTRSGFAERPRRLLVEAGMNMNVGTFLLACFASSAVGFFVGYRMLGYLAAALILAVIFAAAPYVYVLFKRNRRLRAFEEQFPEAMDLISRALRAGHAFTTGVSMVADELPAPVGTEFKRLYDEQNFGMSLPEAMRAMAARVPVLDARFFVTAVLTQRESGGNLSEVLDNLAAVMRDRFKLKRQIRVISAHGRISAFILAAMPPVLAAMLFAISPHLMSVLTTDPIGIRLVVIALVLQVVGSIIVARMVRIEY